METLALLKQQIAGARREMQGVMNDVSQEMAHWQPPGVANPIVDLFVHAVIGQDRLVHTRLQGKAPLIDQWTERLKVPADFRHTPEVARSLNIDISLLKQYGEAVFAAVDSYLAGLKEADLDRMVEGFRGPVPMANQLSTTLVTHVFEHAGEISAIKGCQGAKGYATG